MKRRCYVCGKSTKMRSNAVTCSTGCRVKLHYEMNYCKRMEVPAPQFLIDWSEKETLLLPLKFQKTLREMSITFSESEDNVLKRYKK